MRKIQQPAAGILLAVIMYLTLRGYLFDFLFIASFAFLGLTGAIVVLRLLMESDIVEQDVRDALSSIAWKTVAEIETEIKAAKGLPDEANFEDIVVSLLNKMEQRNAIERRIRTWDPKRSSKNDEGEPEFRRKAGGNATRKRRRFEIFHLAPQPT